MLKVVRAVCEKDDLEGNICALPSAGDSNISFEIREVTPDFAAMLLSKVDLTSDTDRRAVKGYADTMSARAWIYNAQPLVFDRDGALMDGVKRLMASVISGESFRTLIVHGVDHDTVHTIDQHRRRSYSGVLESRGIPFAGALIRTMSKLVRIQDGLFGKPARQISWVRYDQVLELNPHLHRAVEISEATRGCPLHSTARPIVAFMAIQSGYEKEVTAFFKRMTDLEFFDPKDPAHVLALQLKRDRASSIKPEVDEMIVMGIQAMNDVLATREPEAPYGWNRDFGDCALDRKGEPITRQALIEDAPVNLGMPSIVGYPGILLGEDIIDAKGTMIETLRSKGNAIPEKTDLIYVHLSPEVAAEWLARYNTTNRKAQSTQVNAIARDLREGNWMMNAQPIAFSGSPWRGEATLLNGQHRLEAVVKAGEPIEVLIATDVDIEAFATFDVHAKQARRKYIAKGDERVFAAAAKIQWRLDNKIPTGGRKTPSSTEIETTIEQHPELIEAFKLSRKREMQGIASSGVLTFFFAFIGRENEKLAKMFTDQLMGEATGTGRSPLARTRNLLIGRRGNLKREDALAILMSTWEDYVAQDKIREITGRRRVAV